MKRLPLVVLGSDPTTSMATLGILNVQVPMGLGLSLTCDFAPRISGSSCNVLRHPISSRSNKSVPLSLLPTFENQDVLDLRCHGWIPELL